MSCRQAWLGCLGLAAGVFCVSAATAGEKDLTPQMRAAARVPVNEVKENIRDRVRLVLEQPTLYSRGPTEAFTGQADFYNWLLDHPDRGVQAWRRLGARCQSVTDQRDGAFVWTDGHGSEIRWQTAYTTDALRVWYADGRIRPALFMPPVSVQIVVILRHGKRLSPEQRTLLFHQADVFMQTDNKTAVLMTKMLGASAPRIAEESLSQLETFFSGLVWYVDHHPDRADKLLADQLGK
jgi:hypothetical protein